MFELKVANPELTGATCQVSWCVDAETLKYLSDIEASDPQVVIVVAPEGRNYHQSREYRKVVSMKDLMAYVELHYAGANKIYGFITTHGKSVVRDTYLARKHGDYETTILADEGNRYTYGFSEEYNLNNKYTVAQPISVVVPTDVFAAEPAEWEKAWVNHFYRESPVDQCEFRRRRLVAYTFQPVLMLLFLMVRFLLFTIALMVGARDLTLEYVLHPLRTGVGDSFDMFDHGSIFIRRVEEDGLTLSQWEPNPLQFLSYFIRKFCLVPLMPIVFLGLVALLYFHAWMGLFVIGLVGSIFLLATLGAIFFISGSYKTVWNWLDNLLSSGDGSPWYLNQDEMDLLTCKADQKPLDFKSLPSRKKTLYLRFQDLKSKVCKPFSG